MLVSQLSLQTVVSCRVALARQGRLLQVGVVYMVFQRRFEKGACVLSRFSDDFVLL